MLHHLTTPLLIATLATFGTPTHGRTIRVVNSCPHTVWPGMFTGGQNKPQQQTGWVMKSQEYVEFPVADDWTAGRIWARTGCTVQDGRFQCLTGACGQGLAGDTTCQVTNEPPATLAEFTLAAEGMDHYDISLVDGFNIPMSIYPTHENCVRPACMVNINPMCPPTLRSGIDQDGKNLGCLAACNVGYGQERFGNRACCSGGYNDPELCAICGVDYYNLFKDNCPSSYAYAYDEKSGNALHTCASKPGNLSDYVIQFCHNMTDYPKYLNATATCSSKLTHFTATFPVNPSPTKTATKGTLQVVATVAPGVDGAAALQVDGVDVAYSVADADLALTGGTGVKSTTSAGASYNSIQGQPSVTGSGLVYSSYKPQPISSGSREGQGAPEPSKITKTFTEVDGTTILQITEPTEDVGGGGGGGWGHGHGGHRKNKCKGGQWLHGVPYRQQNKKRGSRYRKAD